MRSMRGDEAWDYHNQGIGPHKCGTSHHERDEYATDYVTFAFLGLP
jgi:hypothetical protein